MRNGIREAIDASGLPIAEVARSAGMDSAQLQRLMREDANPTVGTLGRIAAALGVSLDDLFPLDKAA